MIPCNECRPRILDHLYGLLDAAEAEAVESHLATCEACAAVRAEAGRMQGLFAKAAKGAFPAVRFEPPVAKPSKPASHPLSRPTVSEIPAVPATAAAGSTADAPAAKRSLAVGMWLSWAVAAAVLIAIPSTVVPVMDLLNRAESARNQARASTANVSVVMNDFEKARLDVAEKEQDRVRRLAAAEQAPRSVVAQWAQAEKAALQKQTARHMTCDVFKPASVQPGAPNEFLLVINNLDTIPTGRVVAEVRDQTDAVIYSQPIDYEQHQQHSLRLPASVWTRLTPQSELFLSVASVDPKSQKRTELHDRIRLLGPVYSTLLTTDKPTYRPGETVYFRSLTLDRVTFTPPKHEQVLQYELRGPNGLPVHDGVVTGGTELTRVVDGRIEKVLGPDGNPLRGVGTGAIAIPHDAADGEYSLVLKELPGAGGYRPALPFSVGRPVKVRAHPGESYRKEIRYLHEGKQAASFVAGQTVEAVAQLNLHDTAQKDVEVEALATADDQVVFRGGAKTRDNGEAAFRFMLPKELKRGDVRLEVTFRTQTGAEVLAERVPVIGRNVIVEFFPEGGQLVAGVPCRVYFRATTPGGLPVDIAGMVTDGEKVLAEVETARDREDGANRGIGVFAFTPALGTPVWLKLRTPTATYEPLLPPDPEKIAVVPAAIAGTAAVIASRTGFLLPPAEPQGVVMTVPDPVTAPGQPIRVHLRSVAQPRNLVVGAYTRGRLSDTQRVKVEPGQVKEVPLMAGTDPRGGVVRITVFEDPSEVPAAPVTDLKPVAERLVYRKPGELLKLDLAVNGAREGEGFAPDTAVQLGITATRQGEKRTPAAAVLYAAAVNSAVEPGKKDRLLTSHFLIAGEINTPDDLEHADFLLSDRPKAAETLDLVLATQGWRRFAEQTPVQMAQRQRRATEDFTSLALHNGQYTVRTEPQWLKEHQNLTETYMPRYDAAVEKLKSVRAAVEAEKADMSGEDRVRDLAAKVDDARMAATGRVKDADEATAPLARFQGAGWYAVAGFGLLALLLGGASLARSGVRLPLGIGTVGSIGLVAFLVFSLGTAERTLASVKEIDRVSLPKPVLQPGEEAGHPDAVAKVEAAASQNGVAAGLLRKSDDAHPPAPAGPPPGTGGRPVAGFGIMGGLGGGGIAGGGFGLARPAPGGAAGLIPPAPAAKFGGSGAMTMQAFGKMKRDGGWQPEGKRPGSAERLSEDKLKDMLQEKALLNLLNVKDVPRLAAAPALGKPNGLAGTMPPGGTHFTGGPVRTLPPTRAKTTADRDSYFRALGLAADKNSEKLTEIQRYLLFLPGMDLKAAPPAPNTFGMASGRAQGSRFPTSVEERILSSVPQTAPLIVREYAPPRPGATEKAYEHLDSDTVLWEPVIVLPSDGKTTLTFDIGHAKGGYEVIVAGHTLDGWIGAVRRFIPVAERRATASPGAVPTTGAGGQPAIPAPSPPKAPAKPDKR